MEKERENLVTQKKSKILLKRLSVGGSPEVELVDGVRQVQKIVHGKWARERLRAKETRGSKRCEGRGECRPLTCFSPRGLGRHLEKTKPRVIQHLGRGVARRGEGCVL